MRLKSLEIKGFKSFADKTVLHFDEGMTGVIGPNGCGKSNIIDAIRWVIGEQKISALRSENLDSLVFNGAKNRGASGMAEVSLTFENTRNLLPTEFNTVTVTRKYYRNGDSEYRLNDVNCRLKDIRNLFMDTGISTDSYAIIELGMVDDIIKDKDNSRRRMLEQAAGITIYKTRKHEAKIKLDATDHDLSRIEDLLFEINNQVKTLERQAKKAEKYLEVKAKYKANSIELTKAALEGFNTAYKDLTARQESSTDKKTKMEAAIAKAEAEIEKRRTDFVARENALRQLQTSFNEVVNKLRETKEQENLNVQQVGYLKEKGENLQEFLSKAEGQLEGIEQGIQFTSEQLVDEKKKLDEQKVRLEADKKELETKRSGYDDKRKELDQHRSALSQLQRSRYESEKNVAIADTSIANLKRNIALLQDEKAQRAQLIVRLNQEHKAKEADLKEKSEDLEKLKAQNEATKGKILEAQQQMEGLRNELIQENRILDSKQNEYDLLKNLVDKMEGYPESVKFLHKNADWLKEAPLLSDVLYVQEAYRAAVENVLEPYLNYYVVDTEDDAFRSISLLEKNRKGKAKFFVLDHLPDSFAKARAGNDLTEALSVVEYDNKYERLAKHLLSEVVIAETDAAFEAAEGVVLEKTGKAVKGRYEISGGSVGLFEGKKIGRAKNLEKLAKVIAAQKGKTESLEKKIKENSGNILQLNEDLRDNDIRKLQQEVMELSNSLNVIGNKIESQQQQDESASSKLEAYTDQLEQTHDGIADTRERLEALLEQTTEQEHNLNEAEADFKELQITFEVFNRQFNENNLSFTKQQNKVGSLQQELEFKSRQLEDLQQQIKNSRQQLSVTTVQIEKINGEIAAIRKNSSALMHEKEAKEKEVNAADSAFHIFRNELTELEDNLRKLQREKEGEDNTLSDTKDKLNELKLQLAGLKERLKVEFKVDIDDILEEERETDLSKEELEGKNERYKKRLENFGDVNPMAVEAYTEMKNRHDFINEQKDDLVSARKSLLQTIEEVETTANQKFLDTFNQVRENFKQVFKALFTEDDTADMVLENPENLAETGIDIIAKPKGKRPTSITQLSGGEKTLTATALLFSIYLIKPAPFCILDEVDAPLDDINVIKFTDMIRKFSNRSQFIIITHNKMTMASVDVIYGVTMQEAGVSKLVPVDFRGLENEYDVVEEAQAG